MSDEVIGVVGAGILGLAIARELAARRPGARVVVFEKEDRVAAHQTGHNSGVVHAGIYYQPGSLKALLCTRGGAMLREFCAERHLPYEECGKLVVAVDADEVPRMDALAERAGTNLVPGLRRVGPQEMREFEPSVTGLAALWSPRTAITDYVRIGEALADDVRAAGGEVRLGYPVSAVNPTGSRLEVVSSLRPGTERIGGRQEGDYREGNGAGPGSAGRRGSGGGSESAYPQESDPERRRVVVDRLVVCAGLQTDLVARLAGDVPGPRIVPFRGEYMRISEAKAHLIRGLIYPVPDPRYPFLGVHFTRRVDGTVEVGPNAVLATAREGYRRGDLSVRDLAGIASWPGTWRMAARHWRTGLREMHGSLSKNAYMKAAQRYVADIGAGDVVRASSGVRAQALDHNGALVDDFRIHRLGPVTAIRNAPSPAATSCLAIAEHVADALES